MCIDQNSDYLPLYSSNDEGSDIGTPVTKASLESIMREVSTTGLTWADLREQYLPRQSTSAPLSLTATDQETFAKAGITRLDNDMVVDEAYSQAAAMAAYGVELLHLAFSGPQIHRRQIIQVDNMLTTLCASLSDTHDLHRAALSKVLADKTDAYRRLQRVEEKMESKGASSLELIRTPGSSRLHRQARRGGRSAARERNHPYRRERRHSEASQKLHGRESSANTENVPLAPLLSILSDSDSTLRESVDGTDSISATDSTAAVAVVPRVSRQVELPAEFSLQSVVRDGLLRQGLSESAITEYLCQFRECTNHNDDLIWKAWVK